MSHLRDVDLARLVEEPATPVEAAHLRQCFACAGELEGMREQRLRLLTLRDLEPPEGGWQRLQEALSPAGHERGSRHHPTPPFARIAAAITLFLLGTTTGVLVQRGADAASTPVGPVDAAEFANAEELLRAAESDYLQALVRYAEITETGDGLDPLNRLAALEGIVLTTRAALRDSPADPVINNYHLTALGQREALLRRIAGADEWF
jgi:hypothetical protein